MASASSSSSLATPLPLLQAPLVVAPALRPTTLSAILRRGRDADEALVLAGRRRYGAAAARQFGRGGGAAPTPRALVMLHAATATEAGRVTERENLDVRDDSHCRHA